VEVVASLSQGRTAAAQCGLFTYKSVPVIFEPPCKAIYGGFVTRSKKKSRAFHKDSLCLQSVRTNTTSLQVTKLLRNRPNIRAYQIRKLINLPFILIKLMGV